MKTIIVGDLHLDKVRKVTYGDPAIWNNRPFDLLQDIIKEEKPDRLILLGDIFDKYRPDSLTVVKFLTILKYVSNVCILEGNHDRPKMEQEYCFQELDKLENITIIPRNTVLNFDLGYYGIGWCDTQEIFTTKLDLLANEIAKDAILCLHCNHSDWQNEMDNYIPKDIIEKLDEKGITIFSGHSHNYFVDKNFINLGSIMPNNIGELGERKYWTDKDGIKDIDHLVGKEATNDVILLREEPKVINPDKAYFIKSTTVIDEEDLKLQEKDLQIDIVADFCKEAKYAGFELDYVTKFLGGSDD